VRDGIADCCALLHSLREPSPSLGELTGIGVSGTMKVLDLWELDQPGLSNELVHFTGRSTTHPNNDVPPAIHGMTAPDRLLEILRHKRLKAFRPYGRCAVDVCERVLPLQKRSPLAGRARRKSRSQLRRSLRP
jgi:hypothetical protein